MFIIEMILFVFCVILLCLSQSYWFVALMLLGAGIALGCDYPTAHLMISETIPSRNRGRLVLGAFAFQSVGALVGTGLAWVILYNNPSIEAWRWMYAASIIPAILVIIGRFTIVRSPHFLISQGEKDKAQRELSRLLKRDPPYPKNINIKKKDEKALSEVERKGSFKDLFTSSKRATIFASVPWFLQDLGTYGIGVFTPLIVAATIGSKASGDSVSTVIHNDIIAAKSTAFIDIFFFIGILFAIFLSDILGRTKLQMYGFLGCAVGLGIAAFGHYIDSGLLLIFIGFIIFQFMTNLGPNAQTYLIAGEVFPVKIRAKGAGFAASFAKIGAIMTTFLFPWLIGLIGTTYLLIILVGTSLLGIWVTYYFGYETKGISMDE
jgi:MFS family permease